MANRSGITSESVASAFFAARASKYSPKKMPAPISATSTEPRNIPAPIGPKRINVSVAAQNVMNSNKASTSTCKSVLHTNKPSPSMDGLMSIVNVTSVLVRSIGSTYNPSKEMRNPFNPIGGFIGNVGGGARGRAAGPGRGRGGGGGGGRGAGAK